MEQTNSKLDEVQYKLDKAKDQMRENITTALDRGDRLNDLDNKALNLADDANAFNRQAKAVKNRMCYQNYRNMAILFCVVVVIGVILYFVFNPDAGSDDR